MAGVPSPSADDDKVMAGIAYLGGIIIYIPTIVILLTKKDSAFVKFHCFQALSFLVISITVGVLSGVLGALSNIPILGWMFAIGASLLGGLVSLALFIYWLIITIKAFQGETMRIPFIADYIENNLMA